MSQAISRAYLYRHWSGDRQNMPLLLPVFGETNKDLCTANKLIYFSSVVRFRGRMGAAMIERPHSKLFTRKRSLNYLFLLWLKLFCYYLIITENRKKCYGFIKIKLLRYSKNSPLTYFLSEIFAGFLFRVVYTKTKWVLWRGDWQLFYMFAARLREMSQVVADISLQDFQQENWVSLLMCKR